MKKLCSWHRLGKPPEVGEFKNPNCDLCALKPDGLPTSRQLAKAARLAYSMGTVKLTQARKAAEKRREIVIK